jgi:hypothetical protein
MCCDAFRRRFEYARDGRLDVIRILPLDARFHQFAGRREGDENDASVRGMGKARAARYERFDTKGESGLFGWFFPALVASGHTIEVRGWLA